MGCPLFLCLHYFRFAKKACPFMEDGRKPVLPNKVFDCTLRAAIGWKGKVKNGMTLREICETLGVSRRALQGYEKAGLVTASGRNKYGHLLYDKDAEMRIAQIKFYQQLGFTIKEITRIIDAPEAELRSALEQRVQKLREEKTEMDELISFTVVCPACGCEVQGRQAADSVRNFYVDITHAQTTKEKAYLIKNYPIPNTKEDIFEFMMAASSNVLREEEKEIYEAWLIKLEQTYQKAEILFSGDSDFKKIQQIYNNCVENIKAENQRKMNIFVFETALRNGIFGVGIVILVAAVIVDRTGGNASLMELAGGIVLIASAAGLVRRQAASIDYLVSAVIGLLMLWLASMFYNGSLVQLCAGIELIVTAVNYFKSRKHYTK